MRQGVKGFEDIQGTSNVEHLGQSHSPCSHFTQHVVGQPQVAESQLWLQSQIGLGLKARSATDKQCEMGDITHPPCASVSSPVNKR